MRTKAHVISEGVKNNIMLRLNVSEITAQELCFIYVLWPRLRPASWTAHRKRRRVPGEASMTPALFALLLHLLCRPATAQGGVNKPSRKAIN